MKYKNWVDRYIKYSGLKIRVYNFIKIACLLPLIFIPISILLYVLFGLFYCLVTLGILIFLEFLWHISLVSLSSKRASIAEEMLPDALRLISSNLRAGVIPEKAFIESARPEFGPLSEQIREAGKSLVLGKQIKEAFDKIPEKINSKLLRKTINLISDGIAKGGALTPLLDGLSDDIKSSLMLRNDIKAQVASYSMFILLALGIGAPLLYASSLFLVETLIGLGAILPTETLQTGGISLSFSGINLSKEFLLNYSVLLMSLSAILGSVLIGLIKDGKEIAGLKYVPIILTLDLGIFYVIKFILLASFAVF
jgi:flagellar protein FlaJ